MFYRGRQEITKWNNQELPPNKQTNQQKLRTENWLSSLKKKKNQQKSRPPEVPKPIEDMEKSKNEASLLYVRPLKRGSQHQKSDMKKEDLEITLVTDQLNIGKDDCLQQEASIKQATKRKANSPIIPFQNNIMKKEMKSKKLSGMDKMKTFIDFNHEFSSALS